MHTRTHTPTRAAAHVRSTHSKQGGGASPSLGFDLLPLLQHHHRFQPFWSITASFPAPLPHCLLPNPCPPLPCPLDEEERLSGDIVRPRYVLFLLLLHRICLHPSFLLLLLCRREAPRTGNIPLQRTGRVPPSSSRCPSSGTRASNSPLIRRRCLLHPFLLLLHRLTTLWPDR